MHDKLSVNLDIAQMSLIFPRQVCKNNRHDNLGLMLGIVVLSRFQYFKGKGIDYLDHRYKRVIENNEMLKSIPTT